MKFTDLAFSPLMRMNEVNRYSSVYQETNERLSDHITDVMMMSYIVASDLINIYNESIDLGLLLQKCLFHDIDEVITGDIPRNTKYATKSCHKELNEVATLAINSIDNNSSINIKELWDTSKEGKEGYILHITDMLCVVKKCITEVKLRGNMTFLKVVNEVSEHLKYMMSVDKIREYFSEDSSKYIISILDDALDEIISIRKSYDEFINKYHIKENTIESQE